MFCKQCGKELSDGASFCGNCGHPVEKEDSNVKPKRKKPIVGIVILVLILIVVVLVVALVLVLRNSSGTAEKDAEDKVEKDSGKDIGKEIEDDIESELNSPSEDIALNNTIDPEKLVALEECVEAYREYIENHGDVFGNVLGYRLVYIAGSDYPLCMIAKLPRAGFSEVDIRYLSYLPTISTVLYDDQFLRGLSDRIFDDTDSGEILTISYNEQTEYLQTYCFLYGQSNFNNKQYPTETHFYYVYKYSIDSGNMEKVFDGVYKNYYMGNPLSTMRYDLDLPVSGNNITEKQFNDYLNAYGEFTDSFTWEDMYDSLDEAMEAITAK